MKYSKTELKQALTRLNLKKEKKKNNVSNVKHDIVELLRVGKDEQARVKVFKRNQFLIVIIEGHI